MAEVAAVSSTAEDFSQYVAARHYNPQRKTLRSISLSA